MDMVSGWDAFYTEEKNNWPKTSVGLLRGCSVCYTQRL